MPETPDFNQMAMWLALQVNHRRLGLDDVDTLAAALRQVWNTRGAADLAAVEKEYSRSECNDIGEDYDESVLRAIRSLDR